MPAKQLEHPATCISQQGKYPHSQQPQPSFACKAASLSPLASLSANCKADSQAVITTTRMPAPPVAAHKQSSASVPQALPVLRMLDQQYPSSPAVAANDLVDSVHPSQSSLAQAGPQLTVSPPASPVLASDMMLDKPTAPAAGLEEEKEEEFPSSANQLGCTDVSGL